MHRHLLIRFALLASLLAFTGTPAADRLRSGFQNPPPEARPWVYWFWLNGNITSNGITADLEAMQRVGIGGVLIMEVDQGTPKGGAAFGGPHWRELFKHVLAEAKRLGLEVNMNNDAGWCGSGGPWITPDLAMQKVVTTETNVTGPRRFDAALPQPLTVSNYYRDIAVFAFPTPAGDGRIEKLPAKSALVPAQLSPQANWPQLPPPEIIAREQLVNLTARLDRSGRLTWDAPPGNWTILRLGHTPTGKDNHPAPEAGRGLECDKLSRAATDAMFAGLMGRLVADSKPLVGRTLVSTHIDSWETGSQNWTPRFREEFRRWRGYDPLPWLPVFAGRIMESLELSERFLWDVRLTVSDLLIQNYAGRFRELAHRHGLRLSIEAYDGNPCADLPYAGQADEPMAEFWSWGFTTPYSCTEMASAAHVYGRRILGAEAFTATDGEKWLHHPASIKTLGDWAFCEGINRFVFHRYALQPWTIPPRAPGMSMGPWGLHYERTQTWWEQSSAWHEYLARCQFLLRQGRFVADICYLTPEGSPMRFSPSVPGRTGNTPERPGYNYDGCPPEVLLSRMKVKAGQLVLPDGMSYRMLVLPQTETMTPTLLRRIRELVRDGATVLGPPPQKSPSLADYPKCDVEVRTLVREIWGGADASEHRLGHGRVLWQEAFRTALPELGQGSPFQRAKWIWHAEGSPAVMVPPGKRFFRRLLVLASPRELTSAQMAMTADNGFELWVNGERAGAGADANRIFRLDIARWLKPGTNVLAIAAFNAHDYPNPAALIGALTLRFRDGTSREVVTDSQWESARTVAPAWLAEAQPTVWSPALEVGPLGLEPFPLPEQTRPPAYVYPDFTAITNVLAQMGVPPDFAADPDFRFTHRRTDEAEIYFVANRTNEWRSSLCAFRVTGKVPELWNPETGEARRQLIYEERAGRTWLPLWLEPAGSRFVVFRQAGRNPAAPIVALTRGGQDLSPSTTGAKAEPPVAEVIQAGSGEKILRARLAGHYELRSAAGQSETITVPMIPTPVGIDGPWTVAFEPHRGAPTMTTFEHLLSWSDHADPGVKYFSGHATYQTKIRLAPGSCSPHVRWILDLGRVEVIAEARINGRSSGVLWKPPYQADVTDALQVGENSLEVRVVNLWVNRQIGDEQLPEDSARNPDGTLKSWPRWLDEYQPSPSGRFSFASWRLWGKADAPVASGLLGPVRLEAVAEVRLR